MELGSILLFSWFECCHCTPAGPQRTVIHFNTVGINHFRHLLFRLITARGACEVANGAAQHNDPLTTLPFKYRNIIAQRLLAPGEQVEAAVFRPPLWTGTVGLWRRPRATGLALVVTNYQLLVATEEEQSEAKFVSYGLIARCFPRKLIQRLYATRTGDDLWLEIQAGIGDCTTGERLLVTSVATSMLDDLMARLSAVTTR